MQIFPQVCSFLLVFCRISRSQYINKINKYGGSNTSVQCTYYKVKRPHQILRLLSTKILHAEPFKVTNWFFSYQVVSCCTVPSLMVSAMLTSCTICSVLASGGPGTLSANLGNSLLAALSVQSSPLEGPAHSPLTQVILYQLHYLFSPRLWGARHTLRQPR